MAEINGGDKLEKYLADLSKRVSRAASVRVGFLEDATYPDGTNVAAVAAVQNFGAPAAGIPARPFFDNAVRKGRASWGPKLAHLLKNNGYDGPAALEVMGQVIAGEIREEITILTQPELAEYTIKKKGFDKPLVDTGHMLASVDHEVEGGA